MMKEEDDTYNDDNNDPIYQDDPIYEKCEKLY